MTRDLPPGTEIVSRDEFYARLYADKRDIMPTLEHRDRTCWRVVGTRELWGMSWPGWANSGEAAEWAAPRMSTNRPDGQEEYR